LEQGEAPRTHLQMSYVSHDLSLPRPFCSCLTPLSSGLDEFT
jgi:hypothetical protein